MADIRCLVLDVDGVLTDGRLWYGEAAEPLRAFHIHDGLAIKWFARLGGWPVILTGKKSLAVARRAKELEIDTVIQGSEDKRRDLEEVLGQRGVPLSAVAMIGDDLPDLPVLNACGYPIAVANAVEAVRRAARFVTRREGGQGAVREAIEHLMAREGRWQEVRAHFGAGGNRGTTER
ncbi:MAG: HAD hydrolase family protein [Planctomycetes bacterium]|nr:HAD hydrolase family protein [Planctomycetota bacterium]